MSNEKDKREMKLSRRDLGIIVTALKSNIKFLKGGKHIDFKYINNLRERLEKEYQLKYLEELKNVK